MTTTAHPKLTTIIALRDKARATEFPAEAETYLEKAREMCVRFGIDTAILDAKAETKSVRDTIHNGQQQPSRRYPCRFGCGTWVQHTIDELNDCAAKARNANGGNAYGQQKAQRDPFEDLFASWARDAKARNNRANDSTTDDGRAHKARATGSHAYCSHEATKSARARCRRERGF